MNSRAAPATAPKEKAKPTASAFQSVALLLQGGGALGAYQAGVYQALRQAGVEPTWIAGISIGAINSAIIAGNAPEERVAKLRRFWERVSDLPAGDRFGFWASLLSGDAGRSWINQLAASQAMTQGVPGFFAPRIPAPYLRPAGTQGATSWYNTAALKATLEELVDFDRINAKTMRFSVGAVNVRTGNFAYFDNHETTIRPEHIMASGALPPAFDAVEIDGERYWDGGLVSNTPLDWVLSAHSHLSTLIFQVDLWSARGSLPRDLAEVAVRMKEVQFSSRTRSATDTFRRLQALHSAFNDLLGQLPADLAALPPARLLAEAIDPAAYNLVQLIYRSASYEGQSKDYEFSRRTMDEHWQAGLRDAAATLARPEVLTPPEGAYSLNVYDFVSALGAGDMSLEKD